MRRITRRALTAALGLVVMGSIVGTAAPHRAGAAAATRVIVLGPGAARAASRHGTAGQRLRIVGGVAATVRAGELDALAREPGVTRVVRDAPVRENGSAAPTLATLYPVDDDVQRDWDAGLDGRGV